MRSDGFRQRQENTLPLARAVTNSMPAPSSAALTARTVLIRGSTWPPSLSAGQNGWTVNKTLIPQPKDQTLVTKMCLRKRGDQWTSAMASPECGDLSQSGTESIILDFSTKMITLDAWRPEKLSDIARKNRTGMASDSTEWECFYGLGGTSVRTKTGYNLCASEFVSNSSVASSVGGILNLAAGTARSVVGVNGERLQVAVKQADAIKNGQEIVVGQASVHLQHSQSVAEFDALFQQYDGVLPASFHDQQVALYRKDIEARQLATYRKIFS